MKAPTLLRLLAMAIEVARFVAGLGIICDSQGYEQAYAELIDQRQVRGFPGLRNCWHSQRSAGEDERREILGARLIVLRQPNKKDETDGGDASGDLVVEYSFLRTIRIPSQACSVSQVESTEKRGSYRKRPRRPGYKAEQSREESRSCC